MYCVLICLWAVVPIYRIYAEELQPRVFDGKPLRAEIHNYLVKLIIGYKRRDVKAGCSGSILNQHWIISSAHCFGGSISKVSVENLLNGTRKTIAHVDRSHIITYPGYIENDVSYSNLEKDLALLKTRREIKFDKFTQPIKLAATRVRIGQSAVIAGYGHSEFEASVPTEGSLTIADCGNKNTKLICTNSLVRAGDGDSGGALVSKRRLIGVTSSSCLEVEIRKICKTMYVDVSKKLDWIQEVIMNYR